METRPASPAPLVDITSINGIESLFREGPTDPYAKQILSDFSDMFIFRDRLRYAITRPTGDASVQYGVAIPGLLRELIKRDGEAFEPAPLAIDGHINVEYLATTFRSFETYLRTHRSQVKAFIDVHNAPHVRVRPAHVPGVNTGFVFHVQEVEKLAGFDELVAFLEVAPDDVHHVFDVALKYSLYGHLAGPEAHYLAHPIRVDQNFPTARREPCEAPALPLRIGPAIAEMADGLTLDEFTALLHEARGLVRDMKLIDLRPGAVAPDVARDLASRLRLPPRLKDSKFHLGLVGGMLALVGSVAPLVAAPTVAAVAGLTGAAVSIAAAFWEKPLPRAASRLSWLTWALEWRVDHDRPGSTRKLR